MTEEVKKEHKYLPVLLTVFVMLLLTAGAVAGVWYYMNQQAENNITELQSQIDELKSADINDTAAAGDTNTEEYETADWKTYTNDEYEFQLTLNDEWKSYKVVYQKPYEDGVRPTYTFYLPTDNKSWSEEQPGYAPIMSLIAYSRTQWAEVQSLTTPKPSLLGTTGDYVIGLVNPHDIPEDIATNKGIKLDEVVFSFEAI